MSRYPTDREVMAYLDRSVARLRMVLDYAREKMDELPLSLPAPLRDHALHTIITWGMSPSPEARAEMEGTPEWTHAARRCPQCAPLAFSMAMASLGWNDMKAERALDPSERMDLLTKQMDRAFTYLDQGVGPLGH